MLGKLEWFYRFLRPMAAILDFRTFMSQILIDFFLVIDYIQYDRKPLRNLLF